MLKKMFTLITVLGIFLLPTMVIAADDAVPRITIEELKAKMDKGQDILVLDVRTGRSYDGSKVKIKGALRIAPDEVETRYKELTKDKEIITYCT